VQFQVISDHVESTYTGELCGDWRGADLIRGGVITGVDSHSEHSTLPGSCQLAKTSSTLSTHHCRLSTTSLTTTNVSYCHVHVSSIWNSWHLWCK